MAKYKGGFGGSSSDTKSYVKSLADVSAAVKYLSDNVASLTQEQQKQLKIIKDSNDANNKLSKIIADQSQPAYSDFAKQIQELEKIQTKYNEAMKNQGKEMMEQISLTQAFEAKLKTLKEKKKKLDMEAAMASDHAAIAELDAQQKVAAKEIENIEAALKKQEEETKKKIAQYDAEVKKFEEAEGAKRKALTETVEEGKKAYDTLMQKADESFKKPVKGIGDLADRTKVALEGVQSQIDSFAKMSSLGDISRFGSSFGESLQSAGANMKAMGGIMGKMGGGIAALGGALSKALGPIGVIISIAETFMQAEKDQKDFNKAILEGGGALDFMANQSDNLHDNLNTLRKGMLDYTNLTRLGMSPEEMRSALNSLQESNLTLKKMAPNASNIKQQFEGARTLIGEMKTISTVFGVGIEEVTGHVESLNMNLGKTLDDAEELRNIKSSFDQIRDAASQAGYSNKKFFSTIISVTNEVGSMNGRVAEAGSLFVKLKKLIGKKGIEIFEAVKEGYKGKSVQEKVTDVYKVGGKRTKQIIEREAITKGQSLFGGVGKTGEELSKGVYGGKQLGALESILGKDLVEGLQKGNADAIKQLAGMDTGKKADILRQIKSNENLGADVANTVQDFMVLSRGVAGNMGATIKAMEKMGMGGNLAMMVNKLNFVGLSADKLSDATLENVATQELLDQTFGENKEAVERLLMQGMGEYKNYTKLVNEFNKKGTSEGRKEEIKKELDKEGLGINAEGKLTAKGSDVAIKDFSSFIQALPERFKPLEDAMLTTSKSQEDLLQESIDATVSSSDAIGAILKEKLDFLGDLTSSIFSWISSDDEEEKKAKIAEKEKLSDEIRNKEVNLGKAKSFVRELEKDVRSATTEGEKKKALKELNEAKEGLKAKEESLNELRGQAREMRGANVKDRGTAENIRRYKEAQQLFDETQGTGADKYEAVKQKFGDRAVQEITLRKQFSDDIVEKINSGEYGGGSAVEFLKWAQENSQRIEDKSGILKYAGDYDNFYKGKMFTDEHPEYKYNLADTKKADVLDQKMASKETKKLEEETLEAEKEIQLDIATDKKALETQAIIKLETEEKVGRKYEGDHRKKFIEDSMKAAMEANKAQEAAQTEQQALKLKELYDRSGNRFDIEKIKNAIETKKALGVAGGDTRSVLDILNNAPIPTAQDLIISDKGAFRLNNKDDILAMKPGGAVEEYVKSTGGMNKGGNVTININGGDEARVFEVVKKAMKSAGVVTQGGL
jgi:hypothetical protein